MATIGEVLRRRRQARGETLEAVALKAGTDTGNLSRVEQNKQRPSLDMLEQLASALETSVAGLYDEVEGRIPGNLTESLASDDNSAADSIRLLRYWRGLSPANRRMVVEIIKVMNRHQHEVAEAPVNNGDRED